MQELQKMFAGMLLSEEKYLDTSVFAKAMEQEGISVKIGAQQDVFQFGADLLTILEKYFKKQSNMATDPITQYVYYMYTNTSN